MLNKLLMINVGIYLLLLLGYLISKTKDLDIFYDPVMSNYLGTQPTFGRLLWRIWTPITYMFVHTEFTHLFWNMIWLFFMGMMFYTHFNNKQALGLYLLGGLGGAAIYVITYSILSWLGHAHILVPCIGASASVTAIVIAICVYQPDTEVLVFGIIPLKMKWLGLIYIAYDVLQMSTGSNAGGHLAHLGGAVAGALFGWKMRQGKDITRWINNIIDKIVTLWPFGKKKGGNATMHISYRNTSKAQNATPANDGDYNKDKADRQKKTDEILDKISKSGYNSLTKEEKDFLFSVSKK